MKIWVDDIRPAPEGWWWLTTSALTIGELRYQKQIRGQVTLMSLDHDLGGDDTTRPIVIWMIENNFWPLEVVVHSANPIGRDWLEGMVDRYHPKNSHKWR